MKFDCTLCGSICCINPPMISSFAEIEKAKRLGAEIVALEKMPGRYVVAVAKNPQTPGDPVPGCRAQYAGFQDPL